jgi:hypothetical protein
MPTLHGALKALIATELDRQASVPLTDNAMVKLAMADMSALVDESYERTSDGDFRPLAVHATTLSTQVFYSGERK